MALINIQNLTFAYDGSYDNIFENVSFQIDTDWKLGFTGRNGRGKTTFLHLLMGKHEYKGKITHGVNFCYFPFEVADRTTLTLAVVDEINPTAQAWQIERELSLLDVPLDVLHRPFDTLSNGEQTKVMLAALFTQDNGFLLIDEPTNHLDCAGRETVSRYLNGKSGYILVSHDRAFLDGCVDHILSINKAKIDIQRGNFSSWIVNKEREDAFELAENEKLAKDIKRLNQASRRTSGWSDAVEKTKFGGSRNEKSGLRPDRGFIGAKSAKMMKQAKNLERRQQGALDEKSKLLKNIEQTAPLKMHPLDYHANRLALLEKVSISYGEKCVCDNVSFQIERGDRIALQGKNGSGKSSIIKLLCGQNIPYTGSVQRGSNLIISYVSQDTTHLCGDLQSFAKEHGIDESLFKTILRHLDFSRVQFEKDIADFSAGQKKKVLLAKSLAEKAHLYIWDEPLNFIDVLSRMQIEELLLNFKPTMLFVEHDRAFAQSVATKFVELG